MGSSTCQQTLVMRGDTHFQVTRWTRICRARDRGAPGAEEALAELCQEYWYPLYAFVRRRGHSPEEAQDLTQSFLARLLEKQYLRRADPERGRFRTFLLHSLEHFLINEWKKGQTAKRGGQCSFVCWEELRAEDRYRAEPFHELSPDKLYDRRWSLALIDRAMEALRQEHTTVGEQAIFDVLQPFFSGSAVSETYKGVAARLGMSEDAVKMRIHRLKRRFAVLLREQVADTVEGDGAIDEEMRHLFAAWD